MDLLLIIKNFQAAAGNSLISIHRSREGGRILTIKILIMTNPIGNHWDDEGFIKECKRNCWNS